MAPGLPAGQSYDAANILFSPLNQGKNPKGILRAMRDFSQYNGVSGELHITLEGRTFLPTALFEIEKSGDIKRISSLD